MLLNPIMRTILYTINTYKFNTLYTTHTCHFFNQRMSTSCTQQCTSGDVIMYIFVLLTQMTYFVKRDILRHLDICIIYDI